MKRYVLGAAIGSLLACPAFAQTYIAGTFSAAGFTPASVGTPITATTAGATGALPGGSTVVATNVGTTNGAYCALGSASSIAQQYIGPNGGWFAFTIPSGTNQMTCVTSSSTTTINLVGGAGLATGAVSGSAGGGGGGSSITEWAGGTLGAMANYGASPGAVLVPGVNAFVTNSPAVTQSGSWTDRVVGNAGGIFDGATNASVPANALYMGMSVAGTLTGLIGSPNGLKVDGSAVTQPISGTVSVTGLGSPFQAGGSIANTAFGISGPLPAFAAPPTFNLGALNGAATASNQTAIQGSLSGGTAASLSEAVGGVYNVTLPTLTNGQQAAAQLDASGRMLTNPSTVTQPVSATSLPLPSGAATAANQPALNGDGGALAHVTNFPATQPVSAVLGTSNGWTPVIANALSSKTIKSAAGQLGALQCWNVNTSVVYIQVYNAATVTGSPVQAYAIAPNATGGLALSNPGISFSTGITIQAATTATGSTAPSTAPDCNVVYN